ncbi:uncharacterized protein M421DRAFT_67662 [Didymella exigua CBS 183.55]|uniref:Extracellular mutant protein 11 C-terminal domain-containing protein n=1 Tax=Didymella exigua CBS 183.55 TaxID=1150837 RepID=A0A6A5RIW0_9PLEO|nr:uncharacterized protein M421DRAFT_67662 [Didymella exigua CBS 183.55]KAF1926386.1 hypothetical protein M421DRAFT_67662 [Didymella exigua CBS 183.55]
MQKYVKGARNGRPESPQPAVNHQRAIHAANLKVAMRPEVARPSAVQGLRGRGESIIQHQPASWQHQHQQKQPSGDGRKGDTYDTDAESIDTTVNHSVVQVEDNQLFDQQQFQPDNEEDESGGDEEGSGEDDLEDEEVPEDIPEDIPEEYRQYLVDHGYAEASHDQQIRFLRQSQPHVFVTIDGDSYPTTTDGNPTEVEEQQQQQQIYADPGSPSPPSPPSPSPQRLAGQGQTPSTFNQRRQQAADVQHYNPVMQQSSKLYRQGAQIRGQQRLEIAAHAHTQSGRHHVIFKPPTSRPPTHSQANPKPGFVAPPTIHTVDQVAQSGFPQPAWTVPPASGYLQTPVPRIVEPATISKRAPVTRTKVVPIIQQPSEPQIMESALVEEHLEHVGDYDQKVLSKMHYEELRNESFDNDPREQEPTLPEDMRDKPLHERLQFAQQKLRPTDQVKFFSALPTTEWEDAGDWFLGQFTTIITKTREARQTKRKEARRFEAEIERRHKHVAKKQRLVEEAMDKMKAQGERLVPKSPRSSKSPRRRRD